MEHQSPILFSISFLFICNRAANHNNNKVSTRTIIRVLPYQLSDLELNQIEEFACFYLDIVNATPTGF